MAATAEWIGLHVFYSDRADVLLTDCVAPLVADLRRRGILDRYFFIRYWLEGPHVRLRLRPKPGAGPETTDLAMRAVRSFLSEHPARPRPEWDNSAWQLAMARREYSTAELAGEFGAGVEFPVRPDNTCAIIDYQPEYARYGGTAGVDLAEWHFERSSDLVQELLGRGDTGDVSHRHAMASKLMAVMTLVMTGGRIQASDFLASYGRHWRGGELGAAVGPPSGQVRDQVDHLCAAVLDSPPPADPQGPVNSWWAHCAQLRRKIVDREESLTFRGGSALDILLGNFLHMTNNRLGVPIAAEAVLADVLHGAFDGASA
jgi:thiopeptide-type bacteriocin biosynthesis protein